MIEDLIKTNWEKVEILFNDYGFGFHRYLSFLGLLAKTDSEIADLIQDKEGAIKVSYALGYIYNDLLVYTSANNYNDTVDLAMDNEVFENKEDIFDLANEVMAVLKRVFSDSDKNTNSMQLAFKLFQPIAPISEEAFISNYYYILGKLPPYDEFVSYEHDLCLPFDPAYTRETALMKIVEYINTYK